MPNEDYELDLTRQQQQKDSAPVASGMHLVRIAGVEKKQSANGGEYLNWRLEVAGQGDPDFGKALWHMTSLLPQARWKLEQFLDAVGAPGTGRISVSKLVGYRLKAVVKHEMWNDAPRARVDQVLSAGALAGKDAVPAAATVASAAPAAPKPTKLKPAFDDDIPF